MKLILTTHPLSLFIIYQTYILLAIIIGCLITFLTYNIKQEIAYHATQKIYQDIINFYQQQMEAH